MSSAEFNPLAQTTAVALRQLSCSVSTTVCCGQESAIHRRLYNSLAYVQMKPANDIDFVQLMLILLFHTHVTEALILS